MPRGRPKASAVSTNVRKKGAAVRRSPRKTSGERKKRRTGVEYIETDMLRRTTFAKRSETVIKKLAELVLQTGAEGLCVITKPAERDGTDNVALTYTSAEEGDWVEHLTELFGDLIQPNTIIKSVGRDDYDKLWDAKSGGSWNNVMTTRWSYKSPACERGSASAQKDRQTIAQSLKDTSTFINNECASEVKWNVDPELFSMAYSSSGAFYRPPAELRRAYEGETNDTVLVDAHAHDQSYAFAATASARAERSLTTTTQTNKNSTQSQRGSEAAADRCRELMFSRPIDKNVIYDRLHSAAQAVPALPFQVVDMQAQRVAQRTLSRLMPLRVPEHEPLCLQPYMSP